MAIAVPSSTVVTRADHVSGPPQGEWTYDDYARLPDDGCQYQVIEGVLYVSPSPSEAHQNSNGWFTVYIKLEIQGKGLGRVYAAPFDVELDPRNVLQPDIVVVLKENRGVITSSHIVGAPDLVIEIASPSTANFDRRKKLDAYARAGVPEYWIADPYAKTIEILKLHQGEYVSIGVLSGQQTIPEGVLPALDVAVERFFA